MTNTLLNNFLANGTTSSTWQEKLLMMNEGRRVIFISYKYNYGTGSLKYAASVFRRDDASNDVTTWTVDEIDIATQNNVIVWLGDDGNHPYFELSEKDIENHSHTTSERYRLRPVRMMLDSGLTYDELIQTIRWEMCHGFGCRGIRSTRSHARSDSPGAESDSSFLSTDSQPEMSLNLDRIKTVHQVRYYTEEREIFIAFKGRSKDGEIAYGAAIHRLSNPDERMSEDEVSNHWKTAHSRLNRSPVIYNLSKEHKSFRHQLKRFADHREDITVLLVDNIFTRRGGRIQVRNY